MVVVSPATGLLDCRVGADDMSDTGVMLPKSLTEPAPDAPDAPEEYKSGKRVDRDGVGLLTVIPEV